MSKKSLPLTERDKKIITKLLVGDYKFICPECGSGAFIRKNEGRIRTMECSNVDCHCNLPCLENEDEDQLIARFMLGTEECRYMAKPSCPLCHHNVAGIVDHSSKLIHIIGMKCENKNCGLQLPKREGECITKMLDRWKMIGYARSVINDE